MPLPPCAAFRCYFLHDTDRATRSIALVKSNNGEDSFNIISGYFWLLILKGIELHFN